MDPLIYIVGAAFVAVLIIIITLLKRSPRTGGDEAGAPNAGAVARERRREANVQGGVRRGGPRRRMRVAPAADQDDQSDQEFDEEIPTVDSEGKKIGAKKLKKLQEKAERKAQREAEEEERQDRKQREALLEEQRKKEQAKQEAEEAAKEEILKAEREEQERKEHEEYLKYKEMFTVEDEGVTEQGMEDSESLLQDFINYIKDMKVVMLEDLASHFKMKTQDTIDRINTLIEESKLTGVMDDRGKFIHITTEEYEAVAKFIKQRGRVSISELAESSNRLINLAPENTETLQRLVGDVA